MKMQTPLDLSDLLDRAALSKLLQPCFELITIQRFEPAPTMVAIVIKPFSSWSGTAFDPMPAKPFQRLVKLSFRQWYLQHVHFDLITVFESSPKLDYYYGDSEFISDSRHLLRHVPCFPHFKPLL